MSSTFLLEGVRRIDFVLQALSADTVDVVVICFGFCRSFLCRVCFLVDSGNN
jgi:hypothetical protein